jgi:hypothetical protein
MCTGTYVATPRSAQREQMLGAMAAAIRYVRHASPMRSVLARAGAYLRGGRAGGAVADSGARAAMERVGLRRDDGLLRRRRDRHGDFHSAEIAGAIFLRSVVFGASLASASATAVVALMPGKFSWEQSSCWREPRG